MIVSEAAAPVALRSLSDLESVIVRGFVDAGLALTEIRDRKLYRDEGFTTFADYCRQRLGFGKSRASQMIVGARTVREMSTNVDVLPANEAQARELARIKDPERRDEVWAVAAAEHGSETTAADIRSAAAVVCAPDDYPFMHDPAWKDYHQLEASEHLSRLPKEDRRPAIALINQPGIPPQAAVPILENLTNMPAPTRKEVFALAVSTDSRDRSLALTTAAAKLPMPDPRLTRLDRAAEEIRAAVRDFSDDPLTPEFRSVLADIKKLAGKVQEGARPSGR